jgi:hypothetical protein
VNTKFLPLLSLALALTLTGCEPKVQRIARDNANIKDLCGDERIFDALVYATAHATNQADVLPVFAARMNTNTIRWLVLNHSAMQLEELLANKKRGRALHRYTEEQLKIALDMQGMKPRRVRRLLADGE